MYLGDFTVGQTVTNRFFTVDASGLPVTLAGSPVARVRRGSGAGTVITTGVTLTVDVMTGQHCVDVDTSSGYIAAADYAIELSAGTVGGVSVAGVIVAKFSLANRAVAPQTGDAYARIGAAGAGLTALGDTRIANLDATISSRTKPADTQAAVTTVTNLTNAPTAGDLTATMKTSVTTAATAATPIAASVTGNVGGNVVGSVASVTAGVTLAASAVQAIWDALTSALTTVGSIGKWVVDKLDVVVSTRLATSGYTAPPTVGAIADQVWEETLTDHSGTVGSTAAALNAAGSAGDPWSTALPGAYGAGTAGKIIGDNVNATIGSRASQTSVDDLPTNAELATALAAADDAVLAAVAALINLSQANVRTAIGLGSANLDTQLAALAAYIDTEVAAIKAKTDNLPSDPADASDIATLFTSIAATLTTIATYIDTEVAAIKAKTDNLPAAPAATGDIPTAAAIADAVYDEDGGKLRAHLPSVLKAIIGVGSTTTSIVLNSTTGIDGAAPSSVDDFYNGCVLVLTSGALAGQRTSVSDYNGTTKTLTVVALTGAPAAAVTGILV